uniref:Integrin alpha-5-like n=1 Tax=Gadus morhua TaxID=8049 RepID=A0A8C5FBH8_GADMO
MNTLSFSSTYLVPVLQNTVHLEFYLPQATYYRVRNLVLIGAPKANTSQPNVTEGGAVYLCPWSQGNCTIVHFDEQGRLPPVCVEFKSHQWFGAVVRSHHNTVLACAPRYYWRTEHDTPFSDATGTCYLSVDGLRTFVEYAPCRTERHGPAGQGYCQGGFSADFTKEGKVLLGGPGSFYWQGQVISATPEDIVKAYYPSYFLLSVAGQIQTRQAQGCYDDSYQGNCFVYHLNHHVYMGSYFGYAVAVTDINSDGLDDLVVGAPMFMRREPDGRLQELGRVYVYLQRAPLLLETSLPPLSGPGPFSRFGSSLAPLGDLDQDGFNDMAVGCPYGGEDQQGLVLIYNGYQGGLRDTPTQTLSGKWASTSSSFPAGFGYAIRGNADLDQNGYPDFIVGAFGADKAVLYRARPIVNTSASLTVLPHMFNPEEKTCQVFDGNHTIATSWYRPSLHLLLWLHILCFVLELQLDSATGAQKVSRALFLDSQQPALRLRLSLDPGANMSLSRKIYLRGEEDFRDKLSPIVVSLNFSLDPRSPPDNHGLRPVLSHGTRQLLQHKAHIQLDCGEDNICVPDLKLAVYGDREAVCLGDENPLALTFNARNQGEGGAYEAELHVALPPEADYSGIARGNASLSQLPCSYEAENLTRYLLCDLGNPMKAGASIWAGLRFTLPRLKDTHQMAPPTSCDGLSGAPHMSMLPETQSDASHDTSMASISTEHHIQTCGHCTFIMSIEPKPGTRLSLGQGPPLWFSISQTSLEVSCPLRAQGHGLLYPLELQAEGPIRCSSNQTLNALKLKVRHHARTHTHACMHACKHAHTHIKTCAFLCSLSGDEVTNTVVWNKPAHQYLVPVWIIILAILAGLLLLALLIYLLYKMGFFKRSDPYGTTMEKAQLRPQASSEA